MISKMIVPLITLFGFICHPAFAFDDLVTELRKYVTVVINSSGCEYSPKADGWYRPSANRLELCMENIQNIWPKDRHNDVYRKVLMHEAVHLAQDCHAGFHNSDLKPFKVNMTVPEYVSNRYEKHDHQIEAEAFSYWHKGNVPLELVKKFCKVLN